MRRFRFGLRGLQRLLAHREEGAKLRAAQAAAERQRAEGLLGHLEEQRAAVRRQRRCRRAERPVPPHEELLYEAYFERMTRAIGDQRGTVARAAERQAARLGELREAATRHRAIGLLHERQLDAYRREAHRETTRILDEVGSRSFTGGRLDPTP